MSSHSLSVKLLEYGIGSKTAFLFDLSLSAEIPNGFYKCVLMDISDLIRPLTLRVGAGCAVVVAALRGCLPWQSLPPVRYLYLKMLCKTSRRLLEESRVIKYGRLLFKWDAGLVGLSKPHL
jgi:hypothetical protein